MPSSPEDSARRNAPRRVLQLVGCALSVLGAATGPANSGSMSPAAAEREVRETLPKLEKRNAETLARVLASLPDGTELRISNDPVLGARAVPVSTGAGGAATVKQQSGHNIADSWVEPAPRTASGDAKLQRVTPAHVLDRVGSAPPHAVDRFRDSACSADVSRFRAYVQASQFHSTGYAQISARLRSKPQASAIIAAFDDNCYEPLAVPMRTPPDPAVADMNHVVQALAILVTDAEEGWCMATHLGQGRFVTANHCVDGSRFPIERLHLRLLTAPDQPLRLRIVRQQAVDDLALIETEQALPNLAAVSLAAPEVGEEAAIVGYFLLHSPQAWLPTGITPDWRQGVRVNRGAEGGCLILGVGQAASRQRAARIAHSCQTAPGFSGGPVLVRRQEAAGQIIWQLAAVHSGARCTVGAACADNTGVRPGIGNLAMAIPADQLAAARAPHALWAPQSAARRRP